MSGYLLDINVLIALIDPSHAHHDRAHAWFGTVGRNSWLSCPTTQNGAIRICSHPKYSNAQPPAVVVESARSLTSVGDHRFIADRVSLIDADTIDAGALLSSAQITDTYLLALAVDAGATLATFDTRLVATAVSTGESHLLQLP